MYATIPRLDLDVERENLKASSPDDLRALGWTVAVHNDYQIKGRKMTFWLFTFPGTDRCVKGEGHTDAQALDEIREKLEGDGCG